MGAILVALLSLLYGVVYSMTDPLAYEPPLTRLLQAVVGGMILVASYRSSWVKRNPHVLLALMVYGLIVWYGVLVVYNELRAGYALGYLFIMLSCAMLYSLAWDRQGPLIRLLGFAVLVGVGSALLAQPDADPIVPPVFALIVASSALVMFLAFRVRLDIARELIRSEHRLGQAERLAETGAWSYIVDEDRREWSAGMYAILGLDPADTVTTLADVVHADDRDSFDAVRRQMTCGLGSSDTRFRIVRPDGTVRWVRAVSELTCGSDGQGVELRGVLADVTEQVIHEAELDHARIAAEAASKSQSEFLANMSHEIRTPLTAIIGFSEMLREEVEDPMLVAPIENGGRRLLRTLNSVLDLARMEAGQTDLVLEPVDLVMEAQEVCALLEARVESKNLDLRIDTPGTPVWALADRAAVGRILSNLLSNAIKFTSDGWIAVEVRYADTLVEIVVTDTGRGMTAAFQEKLFEPFRQASTGWARSHEGSGLGMTITQRLVAAMKGMIAVESAPGQGSRFTIRLPRPSGPLPVEPAAAVDTLAADYAV